MVRSRKREITQMAHYQIEFPDFAPDTMPVIPGSFLDTSWRNDACPSFTSDVLGLSLFIDFADPAAREFPDGKRFNLINQDHGVEVGTWSLETDDMQEVRAEIAQRIAALDAKGLNDWYEQTVGYRPQQDHPPMKDHPPMTDAELRALAVGYFAEESAEAESHRA
jgi:hypothetical protein